MPARNAAPKKLEAAIEHHRRGALAEAESLYRQVLAKDAEHATASHLLGAVLLQQGRDDEAVRAIRRAVARVPGHAGLFGNLGEAQRRLGQYPEALQSLERAIALQPGLAEAHYTQALVLHSMRRLDDAVSAYRRALALRPNLVEAHKMLAETLWELQRLDESLAAWRRVSELDPARADAHDGIGSALLQLGRVGEAIASYRRALACDPSQHVAHSHLVYALALDPDQDSVAIAAEASRWSGRHAAAASRERRPHGNDPDPDRRLRVGYLSPDFRNHSHALFFIPLFVHHDRSQVETFAYSLVRRPDAFTQRIEGLVDRFRDVSELDDAALDAAIREDGIDVLVDATMHLAGNRLQLLARKPAPVQASWLAYPGTTGLDAIDVRLSDVHLDPPDADSTGHYSERLLRLPETFWCYDPLNHEIPVAPSPVLESGAITFGCLNNVNKTNPLVFALWARVLQAVEGSRMVLLAWPGSSREHALEAFARGGVAADRIEFVAYRPRSEYFRVYDRIDVGLDTVPHNGGTTSLDSFWMGVPVVTLVGKTVVGRAGLSFASNLGMPELVAATPDAFVEAAVALAKDRPRLAALRAGLRERMRRSPLMDAPRFARHFEAALRSEWRRWSEGQRT
jgi:predicted O-linked N-acetylglucosamine transferase (SPINDLY family)